MGTDNPEHVKESWDSQFEPLNEWNSKISWRIGETVGNKFIDSYSDFTALRKNWIELSINESGEINIGGEKWKFYFIDGNNPLVRAWFRQIETLEMVNIASWNTFRIFGQNPGGSPVITLEVKEKSGAVYMISVYKRGKK